MFGYQETIFATLYRIGGRRCRTKAQMCLLLLLNFDTVVRELKNGVLGVSIASLGLRQLSLKRFNSWIFWRTSNPNS